MNRNIQVNRPKIHPLRKRWNHRGLYLLLLVPFVYVLIFNYIPMYGILMAFKNFSPRLGIMGSPWVGIYNFERFFSLPDFFNVHDFSGA